jgi:hypothetical protein
MTQRDTMKITIVQESEHFVILRPPRTDTRPSELLEDLEFIVSRGFRLLSFTMLFDLDSGLEENVIVCENSRNNHELDDRKADEDWLVLVSR